jgi:geranylgeranyl pyrophosphate synthase
MSGIDIIKLMEEKRGGIDSSIRDILPRNLDGKSLEKIFGKPRYSYSQSALTKALSIPVWDFLDRGGKRWRPFLFLITAEALGGDAKRMMKFCPIPEMLHDGSIMVDDIEDMGEMRRGKPCTHKIYGIDVAVNAGNFMYFIPLILLKNACGEFSDSTIKKAYDTVIQELINIHAGQGMDIIWHNGVENVTEGEYFQMCAYKTGCLSRLSTKLAAVLCGAPDATVEALGKFGEAIGVVFQIQDDILSAGGGKFAKGKGYGDDITEGKHTLIVIHALKHLDQNDRERLLRILAMHTKDARIIAEALELLTKKDSVEYAKECAKKMVAGAWKDVDSVLPASDAKKKIRAFADYLVDREI